MFAESPSGAAMSLPNVRLDAVPARAGVSSSPRACVEANALLPHEIGFFGLYALVVSWLLLSPMGVAWTEVAIWCGFAATSIALIALTRRTPSVWSWRLRLGAYLVLMNAAYFRMAAVVSATGGVLRDASLQHIDRLLFGRALPQYLDGLGHAAIAEIASFCYFLLFPYILFSCVRQLVRLRRAPAEALAFYAGLFLVYAIGFAGYLLVPARGPWLAMPNGFLHPIVGGWMTALNRAVVDRGVNGVDVFPSLHVAASAYMLLFDRRFARWRYWMYLPAAVGLWFSTLYLRFHYGIDVIAGALVAGAALRVAFAAARRGAVPIEMRES
jgi:membrane-associated phospholipid phosphatase